MEAKLQSLKVTDLKAFLQRANLAQTGVKADLVARLVDAHGKAALNGLNLEAELGLQNSASSVAAGALQSKQQGPDLIGATSEKEQKETDLTGLPNEGKDAVAPADAAAAPDVVPADGQKPKASEEETKAFLADLQRRRARQARFGESTADLDAQIERVEKFGLEKKTLSGGGLVVDKALDQIGKEKKEARRAEAGAGAAKSAGTKKGGVALDKALPGGNAAKAGKGASAPPKKVETPEEAAARKARQEADEAAKASRAKRWGIAEQGPAASSVKGNVKAATATATAPAAAVLDPAEEEKKRKRAEKFGLAGADAGGVGVPEQQSKKVKS